MIKKISNSDELMKFLTDYPWVVVIFSASWCPDCVYLDTFIDQIVATHSEVTFVKVDTTTFPELADQYQILGIPSLIGFRYGKMVHRLVNRLRKTPEQINTFLQELQTKK